jgi:hypothetical protein
VADVQRASVERHRSAIKRSSVYYTAIGTLIVKAAVAAGANATVVVEGGKTVLSFPEATGTVEPINVW